jgi:hypothetical protein
MLSSSVIYYLMLSSHVLSSSAIIPCYHIHIIIKCYHPMLSTHESFHISILFCYHPMLSYPCYHQMLSSHVIISCYHLMLSSHVSVRVIIPCYHPIKGTVLRDFDGLFMPLSYSSKVLTSPASYSIFYLNRVFV